MLGASTQAAGGVPGRAIGAAGILGDAPATDCQHDPSVADEFEPDLAASVQQYRDEGWVIFPTLLSASGLQTAQAACDSMLRERHTSDPHWLMDAHT